MERNKKLYILIAFFLVIIIAETAYIFVQKNNNKDNKESNNQEVLENDKTNEGENNIKEETYAYALIYKSNDDKTVDEKIIQLNKSGKNKIIAESSSDIWGLNKKHDKLFYNINSKPFYVDLKNSKLQPIELSSEVKINSSFDFNEEYIFHQGEKEIKRYNRNTKQEEIIYNKKIVYDLFIADSKIYFYAGTHIDDISGDGYYTIDFNGENLKDVGVSAYNKAAQSIGYVLPDGYGDDSFDYLIYNNKKVSLDSETTALEKIMYSDKEIYSTSENINLFYSLNQNEIAFKDYADENDKYYTYNLETNKLTETSEENIYEFTPLYLDNLYNRLNYPPF